MNTKSIKQNTIKLIHKVKKDETKSDKYVILQIRNALVCFSNVINEEHKTGNISKNEKEEVGDLITSALKCLDNVTLAEENPIVDGKRILGKLWQLAVQQTVLFIKEKRKEFDKLKAQKLDPYDYDNWLKTAISHARCLDALEENENITNTKEELSIFFLELFISSPPDDLSKKFNSSHAVGMSRSANYKKVTFKNENYDIEEVTRQFRELSYPRQDTCANDDRKLPDPAPGSTDNLCHIYQTSRNSGLPINNPGVSQNPKTTTGSYDFIQDAEQRADSLNDPSSESSEEDTSSIKIYQEEKELLSNDYSVQEEIKNKQASVSTIKNRIGTTIQYTLEKQLSNNSDLCEIAQEEQINKSFNLLSSHNQKETNSPGPTPKPRKSKNINHKIKNQSDLRTIESSLRELTIEVQDVNYPPSSKKYKNLQCKIANLFEEIKTIHMDDKESKDVIMEKIQTLLETFEQKALRYQESWNLLYHITNEIERVKSSDSLTVDKLDELQKYKDQINSELTSDLDDEILCEKKQLIMSIETLENGYNVNKPFENDAFYVSKRIKSKR